MNSMVGYKNGNYNVLIDLATGTKIRQNDLDFFEPDSPESMDIKICSRCDMGCNFCYEGSTEDGPVADILNAKFIETLHPYTELAIGGGNPLEHPDLEAFLKKCKDLKLIPSMTVHRAHFLKYLPFLQYLRDEGLIYGIGVSVPYVTDDLLEALSEFPNAVVHLINGITTETILRQLAHHNIKILILGYKVLRRGEDLYSQAGPEIEARKKMLYELLPTLLEEGWFKVVSFDNLAIEQLEVRRLMSEEGWNRFYMGNDGSYTMYVDMVKQEFAISSLSMERWPMLNNIKDMFKIVREHRHD